MAYQPYATEAEFAAFLDRILNRNGLATALGWTIIGGDYTDIVNAALHRYGVTSIGDVGAPDGVVSLNAIGRAELWKQVAEATVHERDTRYADGSAVDMSQVHKHALDMAAAAEEALNGLGFGAMTVHIDHLHFRHDPYAPRRVED